MSNHGSSPLPQDTAFDLLSNARRRFVLRRLQHPDDGVELRQLATELAAHENNCAPEDLTAQQRKRTYVSLYQTHIPKLAEAGVLEYDADSGTVHATEQVDALAAYFQPQEEGVSWNPVYLVVASVGLLLYLVAVVVDQSPLEPMYVGFGVLIVVAVLSIVHYMYEEKTRKNTAVIPVENN